MLTALVVVSALVLSAPATTSALSYSVCDTIAQEFVTSGPRLEGDWPYYNLLYTCSGHLSLEGFGVDSCVLNGTRCGQAAADAFCQYLGFDYNSVGIFTVIQAAQPVISMTGEWCMSPGNYRDLGHPNRTEFESVRATATGPFCSALDSVTCVRTRASLRAALPGIRQAAAGVPATAPAPAGGAPLAARPLTADVLANPATVSAGRRMKGVLSS